MNKKEAIEKVKTMTVETLFSRTLFVKQQEVIAIIEQIDEPTSGRAEEAPRYLRNILARLRELPEHDRNIWLKGIMGEFKKDFSHAKWCEGYEQGKFEGAVEAEKSNKVVIAYDRVARAWLDGYEVEQEKLYTVEIPDPNADGYSIALGRKEGKVYIRQLVSPTWQMSCSNQLTEAEIKQDFDWAWQWAKPAEVQETE